MTYDNILIARFLSRPNRFVALIELDGQQQLCHVKNTGRCRELLVPGAEIYVQRSFAPERKTAFDLIAVNKGGRIINMDAAAPNKVFGEYLAGAGLGFKPQLIRPECSHGDSRFDFYFEHDGVRAFAEVKGVTLEQNSVALFPDAPTLRGVKHLRGLCRCVEEGFEAWIIFIIQMRDVCCFSPNYDTHRLFGEELARAKEAGVKLLALDCSVSPDSISARDSVEIRL